MGIRDRPDVQPNRRDTDAKRSYWRRSEVVREYVLWRADGVCERCGSDAPFARVDGAPYLEAHHIRRLTDGGPDDPRSVAGLCPNCHREAHDGLKREEIKAELERAIHLVETALESSQGTNPRMTDQELKTRRRWFHDWHQPSKVLVRVNRLMDDAGGEALFNDPGLKYLQEAWVAGKFGSAVGANAVRLVSDNFPDFEMRLGDVVHSVEITEADLEDRRRGDEYRNPRVRNDPVEEWAVRAARIPAELSRVATAKSKKGYPQGTQLLIYLNPQEFGIRHEDILGSMHAATAAAKNAFAEVWVLWKDKPYRLWAAGKRVELPNGG